MVSLSLLVSTVFGTVSSLHPSSFLMIFTLVIIIICPRELMQTYNVMHVQ